MPLWGSNVPEHDDAWWRAYRDRVEEEARLVHRLNLPGETGRAELTAVLALPAPAQRRRHDFE